MAYRERQALCAAVAAGLVLTGCGAVATTPGSAGTADPTGTTETTGTTEILRDTGAIGSPVTAIRLDITAGGVTVRGSARATTTTVRRVVRYRAGAPRPGRTYDTADGTLTLRGCGPECSVDYTVDAPAGLPITGSGEAGGFHLFDVGRVDVVTQAGAIDVDNATGPVQATTDSGAITGNGLGAGPIGARTENGAIDLAIAKPSDVRAETENGDVQITVPAAPYRVAPQVSGIGDRTIGVRNTPSAPRALTLSTVNGDIDVRSN